MGPLYDVPSLVRMVGADFPSECCVDKIAESLGQGIPHLRVRLGTQSLESAEQHRCVAFEVASLRDGTLPAVVVIWGRRRQSSVLQVFTHRTSFSSYS